jgi:putative hemin transport protein
MNTATATISQTSLKEQWAKLQASKPNLRIREAAIQLGVSEAELLATTIGENTIRLDGDWTKLFKRLPELGRVMSLTRNNACVLEHKGTFEKIDIIGEMPRAMATVIGRIETRVFFNAWKFGFATEQVNHERTLRSLQFFDGAGHAITKIYLQAGSNEEAFENLVEDFKSKDQFEPLMTEKLGEPFSRKIENVDKEGLMEAWANLQDTHDFFGLLRKYEVHRFDALQLAEGRFSSKIKKSAIKTMLEIVAERQLPIMIFVGNRGNIQIHQDTVRNIRIIENPEAVWLNVLDPDFNMHLREDLIDTVWIVKKPTTDGIVTSLEVFDKARNMIAQFFGLRKPGKPELDEWKAVVESL